MSRNYNFMGGSIKSDLDSSLPGTSRRRLLSSCMTRWRPGNLCKLPPSNALLHHPACVCPAKTPLGGHTGFLLRRGARTLCGRLLERLADGLAGYQACSTTEGQIQEAPFDKDEYAALELDDVQEMDEKPHKPRRQARHVESKDVRDRAARPITARSPLSK